MRSKGIVCRMLNVCGHRCSQFASTVDDDGSARKRCVLCCGAWRDRCTAQDLIMMIILCTSVFSKLVRKIIVSRGMHGNYSPPHTHTHSQFGSPLCTGTQRARFGSLLVAADSDEHLRLRSIVDHFVLRDRCDRPL